MDEVFGKSSRSIIGYILEHPGETFDVTPFVDRRCKHPIEEIQAAVDGAISHEQAAKLKECLRHIDELSDHKKNIEAEILRLAGDPTKVRVNDKMQQYKRLRQSQEWESNLTNKGD